MSDVNRPRICVIGHVEHVTLGRVESVPRPGEIAHMRDACIRAAGGGGHYTLRMTSPRFEGRSSVERHRLVYDALADLMKRDIHALAMVLLAPGETDRRAGAPYPDHDPGK